MPEVNIDLPEAFRPLLTDQHRYKCYYGGRGAGKTYSFAICFIVMAMQRKIKVLCCREIMKSVAESVYEVLLITIRRYQLQEYFDVTKTEIKCKITGSQFIFAGLFRNIEKIKSIPELTHCWINEADKVSEESLTLLFPTIREQGSECWIEWNPGYPDDAVNKRFIENPPPDAFVKQVSWRDNPFISQTLLQEKDTDFAMRPAEARHIWEGELKHYGAQVWTPPFERDTHIKEFDLKTIKDYKIFQALDPHTSFYSAAIWAARWKSGDHYVTWVFDEFPRYTTVNAHYSDIRNKLHYTGTVADLARTFFAAETGMQITQRYMDTRYARGFGSTQSNLINNTRGLVEDFADPKNGGILYLLPAEANLDSARDTIKKSMQWNKLAERTVLNEPILYVSNNCKNLIRSLSLHRYEEDFEKETEVYKDHSDCLRILFAGLGEYRWPAKPKPRPESGFAGSGGWMGS